MTDPQNKSRITSRKQAITERKHMRMRMLINFFQNCSAVDEAAFYGSEMQVLSLTFPRFARLGGPTAGVRDWISYGDFTQMLSEELVHTI